jgi:hypothetical protein
MGRVSELKKKVPPFLISIIEGARVQVVRKHF